MREQASMREQVSGRDLGTGPLYAFEGISPTIDPEAWVAPAAAVIGNVTVGPRSGIWFGCVLRGDTNVITVGARTNIQDGTIIHVNGRDFPAIIGDDVTVGHACIIHACTLRNGAFVGMGATVLDGAVIEEGGMLAAGGLLTNNKVIGPNELWSGAPAKLWRVMSAEERTGFDYNAKHYVELAARFKAGLGRAG